MTTTVDPDNTITQPELHLAVRKNAVREFHIEQVAPGAFVVRVRLNWRPEDLYLVTRRNRAQPRCFKDFDRLLQQIEEKYPKIIDIHLHLLPKMNN